MFRNLEAEIKRAGLSRKELVSQIGCDASTLSGKLNGKTSFTIREAKRMRAIQQELVTQRYELKVLRSHIYTNRRHISSLCTALDKSSKLQKLQRQNLFKRIITRIKLKHSFLG